MNEDIQREIREKISEIEENQPTVTTSIAANVSAMRKFAQAFGVNFRRRDLIWRFLISRKSKQHF